jgi:hypothetical protein
MMMKQGIRLIGSQFIRHTIRAKRKAYVTEFTSPANIGENRFFLSGTIKYQDILLILSTRMFSRLFYSNSLYQLEKNGFSPDAIVKKKNIEGELRK